MATVMLDWSLHKIKEITKSENPAVRAEILKDFQNRKKWGMLCFYRNTLEGSLRRWIAPPPPLSTPITSPIPAQRERERDK